MDISVRSPHGDADVSITADDSTTVADVVVVVTGQAVPRVVDLDGRTVPSSTRWLDSGARLGSVLTVGDPRSVPALDPATELVQLAGPGAGRTVPLVEGRYRLGPARRVSDPELRSAPVESPAIELAVERNGAVRVTAIAEDVGVGSSTPTTPTLLADRAVTTETRAFGVRPYRSSSAAGDQPNTEGTVLFNRGPIVDAVPTPRRRPVLDAIDAATARASSIWLHRPGDDATIVVGVVVDDDGSWRSASVPALPGHGASTPAGIAIVGSEHTRSGIARTIVAELAASHSPRELRIGVLTANPAAWEWAKWLPHLRRSGRTALVHPDRWAELADDGSESSLVVVDDPASWTRLDSPLRGRWADLGPNTTVVVSCSTRSEVPSVCTTTLDEHRNGRIRIAGARRTTIDDVLPAVADEATVEVLARLLAPLVDADDTAGSHPPSTTSWPEFCAVDVDLGVDDLRARWAGAPPIETPPSIVVSSASLPTAIDVAAAMALDLALRRSPDDLRILQIADRDTGVGRLPHCDPTLPLTGDDDRPSLAALGVDRLGRRLRSLLDGRGGPQHVVVLVAVADDADEADRTAVQQLAELADDDLTVIVATDATAAAFDASRTVSVNETTRHLVVSITDAIGHGTGDGTGDGTEIARTVMPRALSGLDVRPFVVGRHPTTNERRIDHHRPRGTHPDVERLIGVAVNAAGPRDLGPRLAPPAVPEQHRLDALLDRYPGDAVPLGLIDDPETDDDTVWWWRPADDSLLAVGGASTAIAGLIPSLLRGIGARFGDDDLHVVTVSAADDTRTAAAALAQSVLTLHPDELGDSTGIVGTDADRPLVVLVDDLVTASHTALGGLLDGLPTHARVVATSSAPPDAAVSARFPRHLVGAIDDADAARLGVRRAPRHAAYGVLLDTGETVVIASVGDAEPDDADADGGDR